MNSWVVGTVINACIVSFSWASLLKLSINYSIPRVYFDELRVWRGWRSAQRKIYNMDVAFFFLKKSNKFSITASEDRSSPNRQEKKRRKKRDFVNMSCSLTNKWSVMKKYVFSLYYVIVHTYIDVLLYIVFNNICIFMYCWISNKPYLSNKWIQINKYNKKIFWLKPPKLFWGVQWSPIWKIIQIRWQIIDPRTKLKRGQ